MQHVLVARVRTAITKPNPSSDTTTIAANANNICANRIPNTDWCNTITNPLSNTTNSGSNAIFNADVFVQKNHTAASASAALLWANGSAYSSSDIFTCGILL